MEIVSRASDAFPPAEPAGVADQPPRTREVTASFGSGIDYLGSVAADANISASRVARRAAALQPNQPFWPGALGSPDPAPLTLSVAPARSPRAPCIERPYRRKTRHMPTIIARREPSETPRVALRHAVATARDHEARREALQIPFERRRQGLVEIVDVKD